MSAFERVDCILYIYIYFVVNLATPRRQPLCISGCVRQTQFRKSWTFFNTLFRGQIPYVSYNKIILNNFSFGALPQNTCSGERRAQTEIIACLFCPRLFPMFLYYVLIGLPTSTCRFYAWPVKTPDAGQSLFTWNLITRRCFAPTRSARAKSRVTHARMASSFCIQVQHATERICTSFHDDVNLRSDKNCYLRLTM